MGASGIHHQFVDQLYWKLLNDWSHRHSVFVVGFGNLSVLLSSVLLLTASCAVSSSDSNFQSAKFADSFYSFQRLLINLFYFFARLYFPKYIFRSSFMIQFDHIEVQNLSTTHAQWTNSDIRIHKHFIGSNFKWSNPKFHFMEWQ